MSAFNGTPGPWLRIDTADYAEIHSAFRPSSQAVALVGKPDDTRLIAAAPDLLAALQAILADVGDVSMGGYVENSLHSDEVEQARKAIAAATGEGLS